MFWSQKWKKQAVEIRMLLYRLIKKDDVFVQTLALKSKQMLVVLWLLINVIFNVSTQLEILLHELIIGQGMTSGFQ